MYRYNLNTAINMFKFMGYPSNSKSPRRPNRDYRKALREIKKRFHPQRGRQLIEEKHLATEKEIVELTLRRLHTLGIQKFGSSPFSEHFDRWLINVEAVLSEFEAHPNIGVDEHFLNECRQTLAVVKQQLQDRRRRETAQDQEYRNLEQWRCRLQQVNNEYASAASLVLSRKKAEIRRLNSELTHFKKEQDKVIRLKTGFFRGVSKKERERREFEVTQQISEKQTELELVTLNFTAEQAKLREVFEEKREPALEQIKRFKKVLRDMETDGSLEERWFACEALIDAVNSFLQRKAAASKSSP